MNIIGEFTSLRAQLFYITRLSDKTNIGKNIVDLAGNYENNGKVISEKIEAASKQVIENKDLETKNLETKNLETKVIELKSKWDQTQVEIHKFIEEKNVLTPSIQENMTAINLLVAEILHISIQQTVSQKEEVKEEAQEYLALLQPSIK